MHGSYNRRKAKALSERGKRMATARWKLDRARRDAEEPIILRELEEIEIQNFPRKQGDPIGSIQYRNFRTGKVTRWTVLRGDRVNNYQLRTPDGRKSKPHGFAWIMQKLRPLLLRA